MLTLDDFSHLGMDSRAVNFDQFACPFSFFRPLQKTRAQITYLHRQFATSQNVTVIADPIKERDPNLWTILTEHIVRTTGINDGTHVRALADAELRQ